MFWNRFANKSKTAKQHYWSCYTAWILDFLSEIKRSPDGSLTDPLTMPVEQAKTLWTGEPHLLPWNRAFSHDIFSKIGMTLTRVLSISKTNDGEYPAGVGIPIWLVCFLDFLNYADGLTQGYNKEHEVTGQCILKEFIKRMSQVGSYFIDYAYTELKCRATATKGGKGSWAKSTNMRGFH